VIERDAHQKRVEFLENELDKEQKAHKEIKHRYEQTEEDIETRTKENQGYRKLIVNHEE